MFNWAWAQQVKVSIMTTLESGAQRVLVDTKNVSLELLTIVFVGCLIGAVMCVVADGFVMGVSAFGQWRAEDTLMVWTLSDGTTIAYGSVVFLWVAAGLVVVLKKNPLNSGLCGTRRHNLCCPADPRATGCQAWYWLNFYCFYLC